MLKIKFKLHRIVIFSCILSIPILSNQAFCLDAQKTTAQAAYTGNTSNNNTPLEQVFSVITKITNPAIRVDALIEISIAWREIKEFSLSECALAEALNTAHNTQNSVLKNIFISTLADNYIELGQTDKALEITQYIDSPDSRKC